MFPGSISIEGLLSYANLAEQVFEWGWVHSDVADVQDAPELQAERIAKLLGEPIKGRGGRVVESLSPMDQKKARPNSLSTIHGLASFPFHTDGAHLLQPPRFIVLVCAAPGSRPVPTTLVHFQHLRFRAAERARLEATPFLFRNGQRSFYSTICLSTRPFIRFDQGCMEAIDSEGRAVMKAISDRALAMGSNDIHWRRGGALIINNWNVMHGRGFVESQASSDRLIFRARVQ
jgi:hypothetical protein